MNVYHAFRLTLSGCWFHHLIRQASEQNCRGFCFGMTSMGLPQLRQNACGSDLACTGTLFLRMNDLTVLMGRPVTDAIFLYPRPLFWRSDTVLISSAVMLWLLSEDRLSSEYGHGSYQKSTTQRNFLYMAPIFWYNGARKLGSEPA